MGYPLRVRSAAIALLKVNKKPSEIAQILGVSSQVVRNWDRDRPKQIPMDRPMRFEIVDQRRSA